MKITTFLLQINLKRKIKHECSVNKLWNTPSDFFRGIVELYFTDHSVKHLIDKRRKEKVIAMLQD